MVYFYFSTHINSKNTEFIPHKAQILIKDNLILIEREVIESEIIPHMNTVESVHQIQQSMKRLKILHATKDNCYTSTVYINGKSVIHTFIAFKADDVLDDYSQLLIKEHNSKGWFSNTLLENAVPVCVNSFGHYAAHDFDYNNDGNHHCFVTGMSGSGKTLYLTERIVSLQKLNNRIIVFDTSSSFTESEIIKKLSAGGDEKIHEEVERYVEENVSFYNTEDEIPVNILSFGTTGSDTKLTRDIAAIMMAYIPNIGKKQIATLNYTISELVKEKKTSIIDLCEKFFERDSESLSMEMTDMLFSFVDTSLNERSWNELFNDSKDIIIISSDAATGSNGCALVDMMLMSLYLNQRNNPVENLVIFIDEIQNQNIRQNGSITKILREGRKLHISLNYATQFLTSKSDSSKVLKNAGTCIYLQPDDTSARAVSKELMVPVYDLINMEQGECYIKGNLIKEPLIKSCNKVKKMV